MTDKKSILAAAIISLGLLVVWGCQGQRPLGPAKPISLTVSIPVNDSLKASLLGSSTNEVVYVVGKDGTTLLKGNTGTFASASVTGSVNFTFQVPSGVGEILSVQLNDGSTHQPLALGAMPLDLSAGSDSNVSIQLGSVNRNCYYLKNTNGYGAYAIGFDSFTLNTVSVTPTTTWGYNLDVALGYDGGYGGNYIVEADGNSCCGQLFTGDIAYLGNGDLADYDYVPTSNHFYYTSWQSKYNFYYIPPVGVGSVPKGSAYTPMT